MHKFLPGKTLLLALIALSVFFFEKTSHPAEIQGTVTRVLDGDTLRLKAQSTLPGAKQYSDGTTGVRLRGVDAPEKAQPYGKESKANLERLLWGRLSGLRSWKWTAAEGQWGTSY